MFWEGFPLFGLFGIVSGGMVAVPLCLSGRIQCEPILTWAFFVCGRLLISALTSDLVIGLFIVRLLPGLGLGGHKCPGIYPFLPCLLVYVHRVVCNIL